MLAHPEVNRYYEKQFTRADADVWLRRQLKRYQRDGHGLWLVTLRDTAVPIGQVGLAWQEVAGVRCPEIGWLLHRPFWGSGYATEAASATRDAAFTRWDYPQVISLIRPINLPSRRDRVGDLRRSRRSVPDGRPGRGGAGQGCGGLPGRGRQHAPESAVGVPGAAKRHGSKADHRAARAGSRVSDAAVRHPRSAGP